MPMLVPRFWASARGTAQSPSGDRVPLKCFGHSDVSVDDARAQATGILARLVDRVEAGERWPERYTYADRPIREEILRELRTPAGEVEAFVTRNGYGADVLNTAGLLFADVDDARPGVWARLRRWLRRQPAPAVDANGIPLSIAGFAATHPSWALRVYRTHSGWRVVAMHDLFDPTSDATIAALRALGSDPQYVRLTRAQRCFRARLTPKPWRCGMPRPDRTWPREDRSREERYARWLRAYSDAGAAYAVCRFVAELGSRRRCEEAERLVRVHDEATRAASGLPLA